MTAAVAAQIDHADGVIRGAIGPRPRNVALKRRFDATGHGPLRYLEDRGDLPISKTLQLLEDEDFSVLVPDSLQPLR